MNFYNLLPKLGKCTGFALCVLIATGVFANDVDFVKDIKPILENHCISCHGPELDESFRIDIRDDAMDYIEDSAEDSHFFQVLVSDDEEELMPPPDEGTPLTTKQIELVKNWIDEGADWPEDVELVDTSEENTSPEQSEPKEDPKTETTPADSIPADTDQADKKPLADSGSEKEKQPVDKTTQRVYNAIGSLHPAAVHLPIGLLLASGLFALFSLRGNFVMSDCAYYCLWLGTIGAIFACVSGWWFSPMEKRGTVEAFTDLFNQDHKVFWHRTGGLIVTAAALLLALFAASARNRDPDDGMLWKIGLILLAGGIGWVGHTGGELHYPSDHYKDLNELYQSIVDPDAAPVEHVEGGAAETSNGKKENDSDPASRDAESNKTANPDDEIGKVSEEKSIKAIDQEMTK